VIQIDQHTWRSGDKMLSMVKTLTKKQQDKLILAEATIEMAKPVMTLSARAQRPIVNARLVVKHDADKRTVDVHPAAVVVDKS
jgi:hypothetical protein